ncbi:hypothetical protein PDJAM_G00248300 [Pangasius djambal]|uniref:Uncharacterized protein n=1 Tax=Pangasius djambal TaxID=1691987 RepID=A0ACC5YIU8_9TELE|nr:hypothetical protein [Pangasius djambal]
MNLSEGERRSEGGAKDSGSVGTQIESEILCSNMNLSEGERRSEGGAKDSGSVGTQTPPLYTLRSLYLLERETQRSCHVNYTSLLPKHYTSHGVLVMRLCLSDAVRRLFRDQGMRIVWTFLRRNCLKETVPWC